MILSIAAAEKYSPRRESSTVDEVGNFLIGEVACLKKDVLVANFTLSLVL